ncbi:hypothetical protein QBC45DRAFT_472002 [Copromyces sp. CBS 386.78]|nr:hypothetical protein QBC45DRAFT_472002 [Copromyces sp. CBS 386.78]
MSDLCTIASCYLATLPYSMLTVTKSVCHGLIPGTHRRLLLAAHDGTIVWSYHQDDMPLSSASRDFGRMVDAFGAIGGLASWILHEIVKMEKTLITFAYRCALKPMLREIWALCVCQLEMCFGHLWYDGVIVAIRSRRPIAVTDLLDVVSVLIAKHDGTESIGAQCWLQ